MLRKLLVAATFVGAAAGIIGLGSALFTSTATVGANAFTTGSVLISTDHLSTALVTFTGGWAPGDAPVIGTVAVTNGGTLALRYAVTSTVTNADGKNLASALLLAVKSGVSACTTDALFLADGLVIYSGPLGDASASIPIFGDTTAGQQTGDHALAVSGTETLCFKVSLPLTTTSAFQGAATTATFGFVAEQTKNN